MHALVLGVERLKDFNFSTFQHLVRKSAFQVSSISPLGIIMGKPQDKASVEEI